MSPARKKRGQERERKNNDWNKDSHLASSFPVFVVALSRAEGYYAEYSNGFPDSTYITANQMVIGKQSG
jgi:hypothetical protein